jgi:hypothetical protein
MLREIAAAIGQSRLLGLFTVLTVSQIGHVGEHVAQMVQLHILHWGAPQSRGVVGALDVEWIHFLWNTWILVAVVILVRGFWGNPWLRATLAIAVWHELEHVVVFSTYLATGIAGSPGLLAAGGHLGGGLPVARPDLHFLYNLIETAPLVAGFIFELARSYEPAPASATILRPPASMATIEYTSPRFRRQLLFEDTPARGSPPGGRRAVDEDRR